MNALERKACRKSSCSCCGFKKIKVISDDKTRKLKVYRDHVFPSIRDVVGSCDWMRYIDDDNDAVYCYTEREANMAIFDENVTSFLIGTTTKAIGESGNMLCDGEDVLPEHNGEADLNQEETCGYDDKYSELVEDDHTMSQATESFCHDEDLSTVTFVSTYMRESRIERRTTTATSGKHGAGGVESLQRTCDALSKEHYALYGIACQFTCMKRDRGTFVTCSVCAVKLQGCNATVVKSHFLGSRTHRNNLLAISQTTQQKMNLIMKRIAEKNDLSRKEEKFRILMDSIAEEKEKMSSTNTESRTVSREEQKSTKVIRENGKLVTLVNESTNEGNHEVPAETIVKQQHQQHALSRLSVSVKRYIYANGLEKELCVEEQFPNDNEETSSNDHLQTTTGAWIHCLICMPSSFVSLEGLQCAYIERIQAHLQSKNHKQAKLRRRTETRCRQVDYKELIDNYTQKKSLV